MATTKVALVTGSNKGMGLSTVRRLCKDFPGDVILTARDEERGLAAVETLRKEGLSPKFHQLDIESKQSVDTIKQFLSKQYGGLDVLVNNAAILFTDSTPFTEQTKRSIAVNFDATLNVLETLSPLLRPHARVVNVASFMASKAYLGCSNAVQERIKSCKSTEEVKGLLADFLKSALVGKHKEDGFCSTAYGMSKLGIVLISEIYQNMFDKDERRDIVINSCCPGVVSTDMSGHRGKAVDEGSNTHVYLSLLPPDAKTPHGNFVSDGKVVDYTTQDAVPSFMRIQ